MTLRIAAVALVLAATAACHHADSNSGPAAPPISTFLTAVAAAQAQLATCQDGLASGAAARVYAPDEATALTLAREDAEYDAGTIQFEAAAAQACLRELVPPAGCWGGSASVQALLLALPSDCTSAIVGTVPDAGPCADDLQCAAGSCNTSACPGACEPGAGADAGCTISALCARGLACNVNVCATPGAAGSDCKKNNDCLPGLACITIIAHSNGGPLVPDGTCATPLAAGAACDPEYANPCAAGSWCEPASGSTITGTCNPQVAYQAACTTGHGATNYTEAIESAQCLGHQICAGLVVDGSGNVTTPGHCDVPQDVGGPCTATGVAATQGCYLGLVCVNGLCAVPPKAGETCAVPPSDNSGLLVDFCAPGLYCDVANTGTCVAKLADGTAGCAGNNSCLSGGCDTTQTCETAEATGCN